VGLAASVAVATAVGLAPGEGLELTTALPDGRGDAVAGGGLATSAAFAVPCGVGAWTVPAGVATGTAVAGWVGAAVGDLGGTGVAVGGTRVGVGDGDTGVAVGGTRVAVGGTGVGVAGLEVGTGVAVGVAATATPGEPTSTAAISARQTVSTRLARAVRSTAGANFRWPRGLGGRR
jgi:hypothetical protein